MTTKEQERNALAKIMKIVADLGEGSYIAKAESRERRGEAHRGRTRLQPPR